MLFSTTLISGIVITISSNSWLGAWMGLEINLLSFIPIMSNSNNILTTEASLKYFLIQTLSSVVLLFNIIMNSMMTHSFLMMNSSLSFMIMMFPLLMKSGIAPFHWWFPKVMEGLSWNNCLTLMTVQKLSPLILISYIIKPTMFLNFIVIMSTIIGSIGGFNQISMRKILTYSSINHLGWVLSAMTISENMWMMYFTIYSFMTMSIIMIVKPYQVSFINQILFLENDKPMIKSAILLLILSLGGLPPFMGFFPKWMIIQSLSSNNMIMMIMVMVVTSLITLFYYLRICYSSFMILHSETPWNNFNFKKDVNTFSLIMLTSTSLLGLTIMNVFNLY
uniref:NADH-ubiquinone oxidoreductase chain 2 n=1 Tax=Anallacta methanoides TaxID=1661865 RepID=A0A2P1H7T4_9NEOP|nr:NADH dehydrogenase subunit 2 [Anallacta methanoides]